MNSLQESVTISPPVGGVMQEVPGTDVIMGRAVIPVMNLLSVLIKFERLENVKLQPPFLRFIHNLGEQLSNTTDPTVEIATAQLYLLCIRVSGKTAEKNKQDYFLQHVGSLATLLKEELPVFGTDFKRTFDLTEFYFTQLAQEHVFRKP